MIKNRTSVIFISSHKTPRVWYICIKHSQKTQRQHSWDGIGWNWVGGGRRWQGQEQSKMETPAVLTRVTELATSPPPPVVSYLGERITSTLEY